MIQIIWSLNTNKWNIYFSKFREWSNCSTKPDFQSLGQWVFLTLPLRHISQCPDPAHVPFPAHVPHPVPSYSLVAPANYVDFQPGPSLLNSQTQVSPMTQPTLQPNKIYRYSLGLDQETHPLRQPVPLSPDFFYPSHFQPLGQTLLHILSSASFLPINNCFIRRNH